MSPLPGSTNSPSTEGAPTGFSVGVVDDDAIVRAWVKACLRRSEFWVAGEAATAAGTFELVERRSPALLLIDYRLPDCRGTDLVWHLRQAGVSAPVLLITASPEEGLNEVDVLRVAARGATNAETAADLHLGRESVKTLLSRSFMKLGSSNRMEAVEAARERGLL